MSPRRTRRNIGPVSSSAALSQAPTRRTVGAPTKATAPSPLLVGLGVPDDEPAGAVWLDLEVGDIQVGDFGYAQHCVARGREDRGVAKAGERSACGEGGRGVGLLPAHGGCLAAAAVAGRAPEPGEDPGGGRSVRPWSSRSGMNRILSVMLRTTDKILFIREHAPQERGLSRVGGCEAFDVIPDRRADYQQRPVPQSRLETLNNGLTLGSGRSSLRLLASALATLGTGALLSDPATLRDQTGIPLESQWYVPAQRFRGG